MLHIAVKTSKQKSICDIIAIVYGRQENKLSYQRGNGEGGINEKLGLADTNTIYKVEKQQGPTI